MDQKRNAYVNELVQNPTPENVDKLLNVYRREIRFFGIVKKGADNLNYFNEELEEVLGERGLFGHTWDLIRRKKSNTTYKSLLVAKQVESFINNYLKRMNKSMEEVESCFVQQMSTLEILRSSLRDNQNYQQILNKFVSEYNAEFKTIKKVQKIGKGKIHWLRNKLLAANRNAGKKQTAIYVILQSLPTPMAGTLTVPYFGLEYVFLVGLLASIVRYMIIGGYVLYLGRE